MNRKVVVLQLLTSQHSATAGILLSVAELITHFNKTFKMFC